MLVHAGSVSAVWSGAVGKLILDLTTTSTSRHCRPSFDSFNLEISTLYRGQTCRERMQKKAQTYQQMNLIRKLLQVLTCFDALLQRCHLAKAFAVLSWLALSTQYCRVPSLCFQQSHPHCLAKPRCSMLDGSLKTVQVFLIQFAVSATMLLVAHLQVRQPNLILPYLDPFWTVAKIEWMSMVVSEIVSTKHCITKSKCLLGQLADLASM